MSRVQGLAGTLVAVVSMAACSGSRLSSARSPAGTTVPTATPAPGVTLASAAPAVTPPGVCHVRGALPDLACTPGDLDPRVNAGDIVSTICVAGWSIRVRPPESVTEPIKRERMRAYAMSVPLSTVELDHLVPISLGGASTVANLWPEPLDGPEGAHVKDRLEDRLHTLVCGGQVALVVAQQRMAEEWVTAYREYVGATG